MNPLLQLGALELRDRLARGALRAAELAEACLARIDEQEPHIGAWAWLDRDQVRRQAAALDDHRTAGRPLGPLHGLPVGIKDIVDTARIPTENGTGIDAGRIPTEDAYAVARLKQAGALIMGKTVTTELAYLEPSATRNPHNPEHTPGGSSAGSAAAVAAAMVPLTIGSQTGGSVIRPASYCGVVGFKPSFGAIPRSGMLSQAPSLDTLGVFAADVEGAALLAEALFGYDPKDPASEPAPVPRLLETARAEPPVRPALAMLRQVGWKDADQETRDAFDELEEVLAEDCDPLELPTHFDQAPALRDLVNKAEMAKCFHHYERRGRDQLSRCMQEALDEGKRILAHDYLAARDWPDILNSALEAVFMRYDAIVTAAAPGPAPAGLGSTGSSIFNATWTFCGTPAITLPLLQASNGLPMGVQLIARRGNDARLLRTARWLAGRLSNAA